MGVVAGGGGVGDGGVRELGVIYLTLLNYGIMIHRKALTATCINH